MNGHPIRLLFVVPDLRVGGAERHVTTLLPRLDPDRFAASVVCIGKEGELFEDLRAAGIDARALHLGGKWRAARLVVRELPGARFLVIGDGARRGALEQLSAELGISANVHFTGVRRDVGRLLRAIDVFALSSVTVECFSIALLEAMACARPAVCTAVGGIPEMIVDGETGFLVPPGDPERLAARLLEVLSNPGLAQRMGRAARDRVQTQFSLEHSVRAAQHAIEEVVAGQRLSSVRSSG